MVSDYLAFAELHTPVDAFVSKTVHFPAAIPPEDEFLPHPDHTHRSVPNLGGVHNYGIIYRYQDNVNYYMNAIKFSTQQATWAGRINGTYLQGQAGMRLPFASEMNKEYEAFNNLGGEIRKDFVTYCNAANEYFLEGKPD